jgi:hypothetical protein
MKILSLLNNLIQSLSRSAFITTPTYVRAHNTYCKVSESEGERDEWMKGIVSLCVYTAFLNHVAAAQVLYIFVEIKLKQFSVKKERKGMN